MLKLGGTVAAVTISALFVLAGEAGAQFPIQPAGGTAAPDCPVLAGLPLPSATEGVAYKAALLKSGKGTVKLSAANASDRIVPPGTAIADNFLSGTPTAAGSYSFSVAVKSDIVCPGFIPDLTDKGHFVMGASMAVKVRDAHPPQITGFQVTPTQLTAAGGEAIATVQALDNMAVAKVRVTILQPDGHKGATYMTQTAGVQAMTVAKPPATPPASSWQLKVPIRANTETTAAVWTFDFEAMDSDGNIGRAGPVKLTVAGKTGATPFPMTVSH